MLTRFHRQPNGLWTARTVKRRVGGSSSREVTDGSFWDAVKLVLVPSAYYVWRYNRERQGREQ